MNIFKGFLYVILDDEITILICLLYVKLLIAFYNFYIKFV